MKPRFNQQGQATVEYVLLLVLAVSIMVAVSSSLFQPIRKWTDFYLGTYTSCLLDSGELPTFAGGNPTDCQKMAAAAGFGAGTTSNNNSSNTNNNNNNNAVAAAQRAAQRAAGERAADARRRNTNSGSHYTSSSGQDIDKNSKGVGAKPTDSEGGFAINSNRLDQNNGSYYRSKIIKKIEIRKLAYNSQDELEKLSKSGESKSIKINIEADLSKPIKKLPFKPPTPKKIVNNEELENPFGFGNIFRVGIILIILVAVIYVVGTQLNSISKSMD